MAPGALTPQNYYNKHIAPVRNANRPTKIMCSRCDYVKPPTSFSERQLRNLMLHMQNKPRFNAAVTAHVPCAQCVGGQKLEMRCSDCEVWKGKDAYNKTQWKLDDDEAKCEVCNDEHRAFEPTDTSVPDPDDDDDTEGSGSSDGGSSDEDDKGLSHRLGGTSIQDAPTTFVPSGGTSLKMSTNGSSAYSSPGSTTAGSRRSAPSSTAPTSNGSKWAKVRAAKPNGNSNAFRKEAARPFDRDEVTVDSDESEGESD